MPSSSAIERFKLLKGASERSRLRKDRIAQLEQEQTAEDMEALAMTEEEKMTLLSSFDSVKAEFSDLDGLSWSNIASIDLCGSSPEQVPLGDMITKDYRREESAKSNIGYACLAQNLAHSAAPRSPLGHGHPNLNCGQSDNMILRSAKSSTEGPAATSRIISESLRYMPDGCHPLPPLSPSKSFLSATGYGDPSDLFRRASAVGINENFQSDSSSFPDIAPSGPCSPKRTPKDMGLGLGNLNVEQGPRIGTFQSFDRDIDNIFGSIMTDSATPTPFSSPSMPEALSPLAHYSLPKDSNISFTQDETRNSDIHALRSSIKTSLSSDLRGSALRTSGLPPPPPETGRFINPDTRGLSRSEYSRWCIPSQSPAPAVDGSWMGYQKVIDSPTWSTLAQCPGTPYTNSQAHSTPFDTMDPPRQLTPRRIFSSLQNPLQICS